MTPSKRKHIVDELLNIVNELLKARSSGTDEKLKERIKWLHGTVIALLDEIPLAKDFEEEIVNDAKVALQNGRESFVHAQAYFMRAHSAFCTCGDSDDDPCPMRTILFKMRNLHPLLRSFEYQVKKHFP